MDGIKIGLGAMAALFAGLATFMLSTAGLGSAVTDAEPAFMHVQAMGVVLGTGSAIAAVLSLCSLAIVVAIGSRG